MQPFNDQKEDSHCRHTAERSKKVLLKKGRLKKFEGGGWREGTRGRYGRGGQGADMQPSQGQGHGLSFILNIIRSHWGLS